MTDEPKDGGNKRPKTWVGRSGGLIEDGPFSHINTETTYLNLVGARSPSEILVETGLINRDQLKEWRRTGIPPTSEPK